MKLRPSLPQVGRGSFGEVSAVRATHARGSSGPLLALKRVACRDARQQREVLTELAAHLPKRLAADILDELGIGGRLAELSKKGVAATGDRVNRWQVRPSGTEGYRTAEVTLGGVDVSGLSAQTMEAKAQPGLYFIGEVVDVTGHLGGYNFQWAWSSGFVAGESA